MVEEVITQSILYKSATYVVNNIFILFYFVKFENGSPKVCSVTKPIL